MVQEFVTFSHWDFTQGLEVGGPETTHLQLKTIIFSQVLSTPVDGQETVEAPSCPIPPLAKEEVIWCTSHSLRLSRVTGMCWLLPPRWAD